MPAQFLTFCFRLKLLFFCLFVSPFCFAASPSTEKDYEDFNYSNFDHPTTINNQWLPLVPGTQFVYEGFSIEDGQREKHRIEFTVTHLIKKIDGIDTRVILISDYKAKELVEAELAFFAQDNEGNVWHMGEYPEEYENNKFVKAPTWLPGLEGAKAGIAMKANPKLGAPSISQGWGPAVNWSDREIVEAMGLKNCVPVGCYENVLVIGEYSKEEGPNAKQLKYYAPKVGNIRVGWKGANETTKETLELVKISQLSSPELEKIHKKALALEKHAYEVSKKVYAQTEPFRHNKAD